MPIAAAIVGDGRVAAGVVFAAHDVPAKGRRAAVLDRVYHLELAKAQVTAVDLTPSRSVVAEDIHDLQGLPAPMRDRRYAGGRSVGRVS
jgi:hypothetical protein